MLRPSRQILATPLDAPVLVAWLASVREM